MKINYLQKIVNSSIQANELNELIELCFKIALIYTRRNYNRIAHLIDSEIVTIDEIAIDSIAELFIKNEDGKFATLINSYNKWNFNEQDDELFFLNQIIAKRVEQQIFRILRESDPFFDFYFNRINYIISKHNFCKHNHLGSVYILESLKSNICVNKFITEDEFNFLKLQSFIKLETLLKNLFIDLENLGYNRAIPINALIKKLKRINDENYLTFSDDETEKTLEINQLIEETIQKAFIKIDETYLNKKKITKIEALGLKNIVTNMLLDLKDGGIHGNLYDYFSGSFPNVSKNIYKLKYQNILEYLLKYIKNEIKNNLN